MICLALFTPCSYAAGCTTDDMNVAINGASEFDRLLLDKARMGFLYASPQEKEKSSKKLAAAQERIRFIDSMAQLKLRTRLSRMNKTHETKILLYGKSRGKTCVWLIAESGSIVTGVAEFDSESVLSDVREHLGVVSASRTPRSDGECVFELTTSSVRTDSEISATRTALAKIATLLIPPKITETLVRDTVTKRLVIVPIAGLRSIPFSALPLGVSGDYVVDKFAVIVASSIPTVTDIVIKDSGVKKFLTVGDPDLSAHTDYCWRPLPNALLEAQYVARVVGDTSPLLGKAATLKSVRKRLLEGASSLKLIFFATHGLSDEVDPADKSFLALRESHLHGSDLRKSKIKLTAKPIVVMSACQTGLGKTFAEGMFGLIEAWRYAGASQVVASLWDVEDEGTSVLMKTFADRLAAQDLESAEFAMADAIRAFKKTNHDPAVWAAFNVFGEPVH